MIFDIWKYLLLGITPKLYKLESDVQSFNAENRAKSLLRESEGQLVTISNSAKKIKLENFEKRYSLCRLLLILALSILMCGLFIKYLFLCFPILHLTDMPLIGSVLLIIMLSPVFYTFFYRPMVRQIDKLKKEETMMRELAIIDVLTGLYNLRGFLTYADHLLKLSNRTQRGLVLIYADMDNLKLINDDYGHEEGDRALVCISEVLKNTFRNSDVIGRIGGDEFAILALEAKAESLDALCKRLNGNLERSKYNVYSKIKLTVSLGIIYYNPEKPQAIKELLRSADMLMYEKKNFRAMLNPSLSSVRR